MKYCDKELSLSFSPNVRLRMTVKREMELDEDASLFTDELHSKYISMYETASQRQNAMIRSLIFLDCGLALVVLGLEIPIPGLGASIYFGEIPAVQEVLTILTSLSFLMLAMTFFTSQSYQAVIEAFSSRKVSATGIDPDYVSYANIYSDWHVKLFREKMNIYNFDFFVPGKAYLIFYRTLGFMLLISVLSMLLFHLTLVGYGVWRSSFEGWKWALYSFVVLAMNITALLFFVGPQFPFTVYQYPENSD